MSVNNHRRREGQNRCHTPGAADAKPGRPPSYPSLLQVISHGDYDASGLPVDSSPIVFGLATSSRHASILTWAERIAANASSIYELRLVLLTLNKAIKYVRDREKRVNPDHRLASGLLRRRTGERAWFSTGA